MAEKLSFKQTIIQNQQSHEHSMDNKKIQLRVTGQRWAGSIALVGVGGAVASLFNGADGTAVAIVSGEFVALVGLFLYRSKHEQLEATADQPAVPVNA